MTLQGKVALVTGGGRNIGRAIALRLAQAGADVAVLAPDEEELHAVAESVGGLGRRALAVVADITHEDQVITGVARVEEELSPVDILVNNAGIIGPTALVRDVGLADWNEVLAVNLTGAFLCARAVLPAMMERRSGKIINIASIAGEIGYPMRAPYAVSKWGMIGLTQTLAKEVGEQNIQVNAVCPGPVEGERMQKIIVRRAAELGRSPDDVRREYEQNAALGRFVNQENVAEMVAFLASPAGDDITGAALDVTAGYAL